MSATSKLEAYCRRAKEARDRAAGTYTAEEANAQILANSPIVRANPYYKHYKKTAPRPKLSNRLLRLRKLCFDKWGVEGR